MEWYLPILIFAARICDVSISTVRTILVINGQRYSAATLGFFEVIVWIIAVSGVIAKLGDPNLQWWQRVIAIVAYGGGFATGTLIGMIIEEKLAIGYRVVRVVNSDPAKDVAAALRAQGFRATRIAGTGRDGPVDIIFSAIRRREVGRVLTVLEQSAPGSFVTIERAERPGLARVGGAGGTGTLVSVAGGNHKAASGTGEGTTK